MAQPASPAQSDRRIVTIMFADISGFTAMSERMDPEEVTNIMNECFERLAVIIRKYEGTIDKFIGDCVMVLFGAPVAIEDAPQRALNAAIEMRGELERYCQERKLAAPLLLHIGVNTGEVIYGAVGSKEQRRETAMGDAVNLASRLEDASTAGQILVGPESYKRTTGLFEFLAKGPIQLKGKEESVPVYELRSRKPSLGRARAESERQISSGMVGREQELDRLDLQALKAINGEGSIVHVIGDAGIGKSRLIAELRKRVAGKRVTLLEGRALSTGRNLGYHVFDDLLRRWCGIAEDDAPGESMRKLERLVAQFAGDQVEEILPLIALLTGMQLSGPRLDRVRIIEPQSLAGIVAGKLRQVLASAAHDHAVIFIIEDLHWADQSSIELLESLFRLAESAPVMFVTVSRPGYEDTSGRIHSFTSGKFPALSVELRLNPLREKECSVLLQGLTKMRDFPQTLQDRIYARTGGNPFFVEEIVRSLLASGWLAIKDGTVLPAKQVEEIEIPTTVNEVIMSRFDRLQEELKDLLRVAAVIGRSFFKAILEQLSGPVPGLDQVIEHLKGLQMISERRRQEEVEYLFVHAIMQETIYNSILLQTRRELHRKVAAAIETLFSDRLQGFYGLVAYHYGQSDDEAKLEQYLTLAGEEALKAAASSEATVFLTQALEIYVRTKGEAIDRQRAARLVNGIAMAHTARGEYKEAIRHFNMALSYLGVRPTGAGLRGVMGALTGLLMLLVTVYLPSGRRRRPASQDDLFAIDLEYQKLRMLLMSQSTELVLEGLSLVRRICRFDVATIPNAARLYFDGSGLFCLMGFFGVAKRTLEYASRHMDQTEIRDQYMLNNSRLGYGSYSGERPFTYDREIRKAIIKVGDFFSYQMFLSSSSSHEIATGDLEYAAMLLKEAFTLAEETDHRQIRSVAAGWSLCLSLKKRLFADVIHDSQRFEPIFRVAGSKYESVMPRSWLAQAEIMTDGLDQAEKILERDSEVLRRSGYVFPVFRADHEVTWLLLYVLRLGKAVESQDLASARALRRECRKQGRRAVSNSKKYALIRVETYRYMGVWLWLINKPKGAFKWWGKSIDEGERLGYRIELARTCFEIGSRIRSASPGFRAMRGVDSDGYLVKAEVLFREIGLERDLELLEEVRRSSLKDGAVV
jgi:class 3 adenylate cyclase/tetratricopeptide (TPR) repeat protein